MLRRSLSAFLLALVSNVAAFAQDTPQLSVEPGTLTSGQSTDIKYVNPSLAGKTISVTITDGAPINPQSVTVDVFVNEQGIGTTTWIVPRWPVAVFSAPDVADQAHFVR